MIYRLLLQIWRWFQTKDDQDPQLPQELMTLKQGDTRPRVRETLGINLEGATVFFKMATKQGTTLVDSAATIDDAETGEVSYRFKDGETDRVGTHNAEWVVVRGDDRETYPSSGYQEVEIVEPLDRTDPPVEA